MTGSGESETATRVAAKRRDLRSRRARGRARGTAAITALLVSGLVFYAVIEVGGKRATGQAAGYLLAEKRSTVAWKTTKVFARAGGTGLSLVIPSADTDLVAVGFHQADNPRAVSLQPVEPYIENADEKALKVTVSRGQSPLFVMNTRNRASSPTSAADVAVRAGAVITSPVDGVVTMVREYYLYGRYFDYHVEIAPSGYPNFRVALIHLENLKVRVGTEVVAGETVLGGVRAIPRIQTQINRYLPRPADHVHVQVNPAPVPAGNGK